MTPQHMLEHLEQGYKFASGEIQDFDVNTPEKILEKVHASLYNYDKFPQGTKFPGLKEGEVEELRYDSFEEAKEKFFEARDNYKSYWKDNPDAILKNIVFGDMNRYEWYLLERKHLNHHFEQFDLI